MGIDGIALLVAAGFAALALIGYARALARPVPGGRRVPAQVVAVQPPPERGASTKHGIQTVIAFVDPDSGREFVLPTAPGSNGRLGAAWVGRQVWVGYPRRDPVAFTVFEQLTAPAPRKGVVESTLWLVPAYAALLVPVGRHAGRGWVLLLAGLVWALALGSLSLLGVKQRRAQAAKMAEPLTAHGKVVAVTEQVIDQNPGGVVLTTPVLFFTTFDGHAVTGLRHAASNDHRYSLGREHIVHYSPRDPSVFTTDAETDRQLLNAALGFLWIVSGVGLLVAAAGLVNILR